jgi:hypothetical protein
MAGLYSFMYGAVGGGLVATTLRVLEQYWVNTWFTSSAEARRKLVLYGRPLYFNCHQMAFRFTHISQQQQEHRPEGIKSLQESPTDANSKRFKVAVSTKTVLWYYHIDGIGELLVEDGHDRPMPFSTFACKLLKEQPFRG